MSMGLSEEKLHRYFDGELDASEAEEVRLALEQSEADQRKLEELERLHSLIKLAAEDAAADLSSEELFANVRDGIAGNKTAGKAQPLRVLEGENRPTRIEGWKIGTAAGMGLAVAAAVLLFVLAGDKDLPVAERPDRPEPEVEIAETPLTTIEGPQGSEVEEVDFGGNTGTVFEVEGEAGEPIAVVWINDDEPTEQVQ